jgi:hypothetical protein
MTVLIEVLLRVSGFLYTTAFLSLATTFLVQYSTSTSLTHPRHGLPYPSSRASVNAPTKAKRTGQFDSQTLIFTLV